MALIAIPLLVLFVIILVPWLPKIGGEVRIGLLAAAAAAALLGGLGAGDVLPAVVDGIDQLSWVIMLSIFGSLYAESQSKLGTMTTTLDTFRALFGASSRGLVAAVILTLVLAGSLLGDAIAAATVIGFLVVRSLHDLDLSGVQISAIIVMGAVIGSGMPPITQAFVLSSSLIEVDAGAVLRMAYPLVGVSVIIAVITGAVMVRNKRIPEDAVMDESWWRILATRWFTLVPLVLLAAIVVTASLFEYDIFAEWAPLLAISEALQAVPIVQGIAFPVVMAIIVALLVTFAFRRVWSEAGSVVTGGLRKVSKTVQIQLCAGVMVGVFQAAGLIEAVQGFTQDLAAGALKVGGGAAVLVVGMLTGSQTTAQTTIVTFLGPVLTDIGVTPVNAASASALLAMSGQSMPPVGLTTFVVAGIVAGVVGTKVDPVKVMLNVLPVSLYFCAAGFLLLFI